MLLHVLTIKLRLFCYVIFLLFRYKKASKSVTVTASAATTVDFHLEPATLDDWSADEDFGIEENLSDVPMTTNDVHKLLSSLAQDFPDVISKSSVGKTEDGYDIEQIVITNEASEKTPEQKMRVALIGGLNGDEPIGMEILARFLRHITQGR